MVDASLSPHAQPAFRFGTGEPAVLAEALAAAMEEEREAGVQPRGCRRHNARLLCAVAMRMRRLGKLRSEAFALMLGRADLAEGLGLSMVRVKRALALMSLSGEIESDGLSIRVRNWRRLCAVAGVEPEALGLAREEAELEDRIAEPPPQALRTAAGEPAFFG